MTPVHIAILGLAAWSFVLAVFGLDQATLDRATRIRAPRHAAGGLLIVVFVLLALQWPGQIAAAITSGELPASVSDLNLPTNTVYALNLAFALPLLAVAADWLFRRDPRGPASALAALRLAASIGLSVLAPRPDVPRLDARERVPGHATCDDRPGLPATGVTIGRARPTC